MKETMGWSEAWTFIDGERVDVPLDNLQARRMGWHYGISLPGMGFPEVFAKPNEVALVLERERQIIEWCGLTFDSNTYRKFYDSIWFYREQDAVFCQLRWL